MAARNAKVSKAEPNLRSGSATNNVAIHLDSNLSPDLYPVDRGISEAVVERWPRSVRGKRAGRQREVRVKEPLTETQKVTLQQNTKKLLPITRRVTAAAGNGNAVAKGINAIKAATATGHIISITWYFYLLQVVFSLFYLLSLGGMAWYSGGWLEFFDIFSAGGYAGLGLFMISMVLLAAMWMVTFMIAIIVYIFRGVKIMNGIASPVVAIGSLVLTLAPIANLFPWVWLWCLYVVKTQIEEKK